MKTSTAREWWVGERKGLSCSEKSRMKDRTSLRSRPEPNPQLAGLCT